MNLSPFPKGDSYLRGGLKDFLFSILLHGEMIQFD